MTAVDLIGAHVSIAGGTHNAPARAKAIGATAMQIFTKMATRWAERDCADEECRAFREALAATEVRVTMAHDSYLINLASPDEAFERAHGRCVLALETTAGSGTSLGSRFEELARIIDLVPAHYSSRLAVCADTCHLYSAGYDLVKDFDGVWNRFDDVVGRGRLRALHLNDSKTPLNNERPSLRPTRRTAVRGKRKP